MLKVWGLLYEKRLFVLWWKALNRTSATTCALINPLKPIFTFALVTLELQLLTEPDQTPLSTTHQLKERTLTWEKIKNILHYSFHNCNGWVQDVKSIVWLSFKCLLKDYPFKCGTLGLWMKSPYKYFFCISNLMSQNRTVIV